MAADTNGKAYDDLLNWVHDDPSNRSFQTVTVHGSAGTVVLLISGTATASGTGSNLTYASAAALDQWNKQNATPKK